MLYRRKENVSMINKYLVIDGNEIIDFETSIFNENNIKEIDYKNLLEQMQPLFDEFKCTGDIKKSQYTNMDEIVLRRAEQKMYDDCMWNFINPVNRIEVQRLGNGLYKPMDRYYKLYTAKKYGMKILVYLV